jgi:hypothetical protein
LYGFETCSLTLREKHRLRVFQNKLLRRIFGPKREEVAGELRRLHNEELHNLYASTEIIRVIKSRSMTWAKHAARMGEMQHGWKNKGKRPVGRPRRRRENYRS